MDFSADGSDLWDSTPAQEKFIDNYFRGKEPQNGTIAKVPKKRKKHTLNSNMPSASIIPKSDSSCAVVVPKHSIIKSKKTSLAKQFSVKPCSDLNMTETDTEFKSFVKKTQEKDCSKFKGPDNSQKKNKSNKSSLKNKNKINDLTEESLNNTNVSRDSTKSHFQKSNNLPKKGNLKKKKPDIGQTSQTRTKLSEPEASCKINQKKDTKIILNPKENCTSTDESGDSDEVDSDEVDSGEVDSDEEEVIRNELQNTSIFKKIQKLMKLSPHLNPNFTEDTETNNSSCEEVSVEDWSSEEDEDLSDSEVEVSKSVDKNSSEDPSESDAEDLPHKKASYPTQSDSSQVQKKLKRSLSDSSSNDCKIKKSNSQISKEVLETYNSQQSSNLITSPSSNRNPSKLRSDENVKRSSAFMDKARAKLAAAKFRFLNEKLYTESGGEAFKYFQENREEFEDYHLGYGMQVSKWPLNPVDEIISDLQKSKKDVVIADMGCGDAKIARVLTSKKVHSFDLVAMHECVTACNISRVPLPDCNVDVVVFCLSLMGVNLVEYLQEAYRILKIGGSLKIAEVESRIENLDTFIKGLNSLGFVLERKNTKNKLFVFLDLKKVKKGKASKAPTITLRPCLYKKR